MPVIGTAGHVDHGKSTLIEALTGRDPDRLEEEKRRGLTIDLGFAWMELDDGTPIGFVDVPGHERFIKNMLAGIEAVQGVLFVVAADEGWMPQSEEHLAIIDLLGQTAGVVALTRRDLVDDDTAALSMLEVEEALAGTTLEGAPIVEVASPTGVGLDELRGHLASIATRVSTSGNRPRLWVDRSFTIAGSGTVITGTLSGGSLSVGDEISIWPGPIKGRIRGLQSHEQTTEVAEPGSRTAINVGGVEASAIGRGSMVGGPGQWLPTSTFLATIRPARGMEKALADRGAYHLHVGSGSWPVRLRLTGDGAALIRVASPVTLGMGDAYILRDVGRQAVIAGGRVLDPDPSPGKPQPEAVAALRDVIDQPPEQQASVLVGLRGRSSLEAIAAHTGAVPMNGTTVGGVAYSDGELERLRAEATKLVERFHADNPLRPGMPGASLAEQLGLETDHLAVVTGEGLEVEASYVKAADFVGDLDSVSSAAQTAVEDALRAAGLAVPRASQLGLDLELRHAMERRGDLIRIEDDLVYLPAQIEEIKAVVAGLGDGFTVAQFRDACGISRRQAVPLLEWLDRNGVTEREGDLRRSRA